ncbi:MAG: glycoside hydrolase family 116 protein, partial [Rhodospirillales bacterium]|nr:glycoside hydrolase family 116 protein [Rhodospirillales bacterium]
LVCWYFPNLDRIPVRTEKGRSYGKQFSSAMDVARHIAADYENLAGLTKRWRDTWYDSTLPYWFLDRTFLTTSALATNTCHMMPDGRFYGWEGVYHCNGTCTHVWGYAQAPGRLFPVIEQRLREMRDLKPGIGFDEETGLVAYRAGFRFNPAVDGQAGVIMRSYLTHQMQQNDAFLKRNYAAIKQAMNYLTEANDADRDGILTGSQHNTLDAAWYGRITWLSLYYQTALHAMAAMADEMDDTGYAEQCRAIAKRGRANVEAQLFNGEYFYHEVDPEHPHSPGTFEGVEYSQLLGQNWAYHVGLGRVIDHAMASTHLDSLWKYNFTTDVGPYREKYTNGRWFAMPGEGGFIACTWPRGGDEALQRGRQLFAGYLNESQPGFEWAANAVYMWHGMPYRALAHTRTMHER